METREKNTKERILEEALKLFSQSGYMGTSMNDIAAELGVTKAALYKHYKSKQEILESIVERMNQMDAERAKKYEMPEGNMAEVIAGYKDTALDVELSVTALSVLLPAHAASDTVSAAAINIAVIFFFIVVHSSLVSL